MIQQAQKRASPDHGSKAQSRFNTVPSAADENEDLSTFALVPGMNPVPAQQVAAAAQMQSSSPQPPLGVGGNLPNIADQIIEGEDEESDDDADWDMIKNAAADGEKTSVPAQQPGAD